MGRTFAANTATHGGPAFPLATPGVRVQVKPSDALTVLTALFSGLFRQAGDCTGNPQACNPNGTTFSFSGGVLWMGELQYAVNQDKNAVGLPGVYKLGALVCERGFCRPAFRRQRRRRHRFFG